MASGDLEQKISEVHLTTDPQCNENGKSFENEATCDNVQVTCFTEILHDATLHFQIIHLAKQIYVWIGCNSAKFGHLYAATSTRPNNTVGVTSLLGGSADKTGSSMARRLVLKTGLSVILSCDIPKDSPMIEVAAERKLLEKLKSLGYITPKVGGLSVNAAGLDNSR